MKRLVVAAVLGCLSVWVMSYVGLHGQSVMGATAFAAESLTVTGLPKDPRAYRTHVDQTLKKVNNLVEKLRGNDNLKVTVLDLEQTRDNILREISKIESAPGDAKWSSQEMRDSVDAMLKLLKEQYEKAVASGN